VINYLYFLYFGEEFENYHSYCFGWLSIFQYEVYFWENLLDLDPGLLLPDNTLCFFFPFKSLLFLRKIIIFLIQFNYF